MKNVLLAVLILGFSASTVLAHCGNCGVEGDSHEMKGSGMDKMFAGLELNDDQKAKIEELKTVKNNTIKAAKDEFMAGMKGILTPEQLKLYESMHQDHDHMEGKMKGHMKGEMKKGSMKGSGSEMKGSH